MHEYDAALKKILTRPGSRLLRALTGCDSLRWLNVDLQKSRSLRVDLLGEATDGELVHIELQSQNEVMWPREGEYCFGVARKYGRFPRQIVLYVGEKPLRMKSTVSGPDFFFRFHVVDIRSFETEPLLASPELGDNVIAILTRLGQAKETVKRVLAKIAQAPAAERGEALDELMTLAALRKLGPVVVREAKKMPILNDIMDHEVFGPKLRRAHAAGQKEGREEGREEGERIILLRLAAHRFGPISLAVRKRIGGLTQAALGRASLRLLEARRIEDIFAR